MGVDFFRACCFVVSGYFIIGTWCRWKHPVRMHDEGSGVFGYTLTLGENGWEKFQIWIDGNPNLILYPDDSSEYKDSVVLGPDSHAKAGWIVDGRHERVFRMAIVVKVGTEDDQEYDSSTCRNTCRNAPNGQKHKRIDTKPHIQHRTSVDRQTSTRHIWQPQGTKTDQYQGTEHDDGSAGEMNHKWPR